MGEVYAGLDISDKSTHVCVVSGSGEVVWSGACATDPEVIARTLKARAPGVGRVVLETGALSSFLGPERTCAVLLNAKSRTLNFRQTKSGSQSAIHLPF